MVGQESRLILEMPRIIEYRIIGREYLAGQCLMNMYAGNVRKMLSITEFPSKCTYIIGF